MRNMPDQTDALALALQTIATGLALWPDRVAVAAMVVREALRPEDHLGPEEIVMDAVLRILGSEPD